MMNGDAIIGAASVRGAEGEFRAVDPSSGAEIEPAFGLAGSADVERACTLAWDAFDAYRATTPDVRAGFLECIARNILDIGDDLIVRAIQESGLPRARLEGERARTVGQLRLFAATVREGGWMDLHIDEAMPARQPLPRADLRQRHIGLGPVAVFGASNFPLAFSVAGGDTASSLAAGCPVVVKAHGAHPGTSALVGRAVQGAVRECGLPEGVFSMLFASNEVAIRLVTDARIKAVGFTGSRRGGLALVAAANARPEPIPVYAEMSSINPVCLLPAALGRRAAGIGQGFIASLTLGSGQFCTNPGLVLALAGPDADVFLAAAADALGGQIGTTMLTPGIHGAYCAGVERLGGVPGVTTVARGLAGNGPHAGQAALFTTGAAAFLSDPALQDEIFGASSLVVLCTDMEEMRRVLEALEGQLTATLQMDDDDIGHARMLLPALERRAGRILVNGYPTGVEVSDAMVHGGPFPATSDARATSVGTLAIRRFLRPVCYQDFPAALLPAPLAAPEAYPRRVNGSPLLGA
ncbi:NADP-dependent aldehyde dehydrogenase [Herbaspirillum sp. SJZ107]|nr:NADP-dependent aldehyde dehydrogenase [Herbaspirillum sp. SJZ107]